MSQVEIDENSAEWAGEGRRRTTITFYLSELLRNRARAAYRLTSFAEQDASWSDMLSKALLAEVERRERDHNYGEEFTGGEEPLSPGRPIGY
ncbi:ParB family protein [Diaminobutyricibacter sp. McL0608]|uniref:ParB family protein n=1 Tax=Leifsonia sp. McL0608 TaxID=3143537 RepID=UPI0031F31ACF